MRFSDRAEQLVEGAGRDEGVKRPAASDLTRRIVFETTAQRNCNRTGTVKRSARMDENILNLREPKFPRRPEDPKGANVFRPEAD